MWWRGWAVVHGLAFLHLDGKLDTSTPQVVADQVRSAIHALLATSKATVQGGEVEES
jgi:hypothetical protein